METINRRAVLIGAIAASAAASSAVASEPGVVCDAPSGVAPTIRPGQVLVGRRDIYGKLEAPGRIYTVAEYNARFGAKLKPNVMGALNCMFAGTKGGVVVHYG
jgi:hypothetical protein